MLAVLLCLLAPAPLPKPPKIPAIVPAAVVMVWGGNPAETVFHADGFFACHWHGTWWHGQWSQEKGLLTVEEWPINEPHRRWKWTIKLSCPSSGGMIGGGPWSIRPRTPTLKEIR